MFEDQKTEDKYINKARPGLDFFLSDHPKNKRVGTFSTFGRKAEKNTEKIPKIFTPLKIRNIELGNRVGVSPMCTYSSDESNALNDFHKIHYGSFAFKGVGLTIIEATGVSRNGLISPNDSGLWNTIQANKLKEITDIYHALEIPIGVQLAHAGRKASTVPMYLNLAATSHRNAGGTPELNVGPSPLSFKEDYFPKPHELTIKEIEEIVEQFKHSAKLAVEIGKVDFIEIHSAHGYLLNNFVSLHSNKRTDKYGGSIDNRIRFPLEVIKGVREVIPKDVPLFLRISATENADDDSDSWTIEDSKYYADKAIELGVDLIDVSSGGNNANQSKRGSEEGMQASLAQAIKAHVGDKALVSCVGGLIHGEFSNDLIEKGVCDMVLVGRGFLKNPGLVWSWADEFNIKLHQLGTYSLGSTIPFDPPVVLGKDFAKL